MGIKRKLFTTALTLAAGAIAGVLLAPRAGKETQKKVKVLSGKIKREVALELAHVETLSQKAYEEVVAATLDYYRKVKKVKEADLDVIAKDLKVRWKDVVAEVKRSEKTAGGTRAKKTTRKSSKRKR